MGFFSWKTADSKESIANAYANHENSGRVVYLLQPNDEPIPEPKYNGYGVFGGMDVFIWLAKKTVLTQ
ncbi:hypothetical protein ABT56_19065 [Photobacterium aquae]|uniref:Uncharacterized protein n=1 Tax=Photobacterium aquae TaxID=1195763 RepID=A0A0J1GUV7_9GAMM|nr:hypothetical protein [Photobacterium aquae]KLV03530.1 hypothetical protein ABT56_19065 [Photobacterium aquae]